MANPPERYNREEDEEDEEETLDETGYKTVKDAVLFAIDVSHSMLKTPPQSDSKKADRDSPTSAALKCAYQLMQQRIISHPNDMMGVLLFGTEQSRFQDETSGARGALQYPHCYLLTHLDVPAAGDVKRLRNLVEDEDEASKLLVPSEEPVSMANVLFCANQIFTTKAPNLTSRRLFLVTDNDNPHPDSKSLRQAAAVRAKDLYDLGVIIELFPIAHPDHGFDRAKFYDDIVYRQSLTDPEAPAPITEVAQTAERGDGISLLQSLISSINSKAAPRRALFSLPFEIGPGLKIGVKGYILIKRQDKVRSCYVWMNGEKPQIAVGSSTKIAEDTAREVQKTEIRKAYKFGGETVSFTEDETKAIRYFGDPVIRIIGFKPLSMLPEWANMRSPMFIYPTEADFVGSTRVFSALHQNMLQKGKMAIVWFVPRRNAVPTLAAVLPGQEKLGERNEQVRPPGLWVIPLPFVDDIRENPETPLVRASDNLTDIMREIVQNLTLPKGEYEPSRYPNPALQWFYRILQAIALEDELPEKPEDKTVPKYRQIDKRVGDKVTEWGQALEEEFRNWAQSSRKRQPEVESKPLPKRQKTESGAVPSKTSDTMSDAEMKSRYANGTISKLTVPVLKDWAHSRHISVAGKKADVVERIEEYFENK
ncbi:atp-dependent dna helicase ii subunit 1 [Diplodia corticola]|uniref:ATP-dependent DNA helicase II subunit 1 n=1 Tax=Diplodia corticola TaxID=236234 RepID=A0A1J9R1M7_9PEZI|nr:atp-dependent dna helicase ii subunit 1 [Diplodia corticola]OJD34497.1 atp-dependent dna helicase ii subunit 1 [Diplodia corticola]